MSVLSQGKADAEHTSQANTTLAGLEPYQGIWSTEAVKHLLRRTTFGYKPENLKDLSGKTMDQVLDLLLADIPAPEEPKAFLKTGSVDAGNTWVTASYDAGQENVRLAFLQSWHINLMLQQGLSIREKMVLFWQNHFATGATAVKDARYMYKQTALFFQNPLGNFRELVRQVVYDIAMARYLNNNTNTKGSPNENLARELQELFTIGKGPEIAPGNYTNYTESDIKAAARILTGWRDDQNALKITFAPGNHDTSIKQFSAAYQNTTIRNTSNTEQGARAEIDELLAMIFRQDATALYIIRKLYRYFVDYRIDASTEANIIQPLAAQFKNSGYEIRPILRTLLSSAHFYAQELRGGMIKTPADLIIGTARFFQPELLFPAAQNQLHWAYRTLRRLMANMGQDLMNPPNVAGLPAYYQEPAYHELWINADTLQKRVKFTNDLSVDHLQLDEMDYGKGALIDVIAFANTCSNPGDPAVLVSEWCDQLFAVTIGNAAQNALKNVLTSNLPDFEWTQAWTLYEKDTTVEENQAIVENKLRVLLRYMLAMAEYQLC
jgi:uncharacterized protein (DUF1800 family)